jgi:hypothetical protein
MSRNLKRGDPFRLSSARGAAGGGDGPVDDGGRPVNGRVEHGRTGPTRAL